MLWKTAPKQEAPEMFKSLNVASRDEEEIDDFRDFDEETEADSKLDDYNDEAEDEEDEEEVEIVEVIVLSEESPVKEPASPVVPAPVKENGGTKSQPAEKKPAASVTS